MAFQRLKLPWLLCIWRLIIRQNHHPEPAHKPRCDCHRLGHICGHCWQHGSPRACCPWLMAPWPSAAAGVSGLRHRFWLYGLWGQRVLELSIPKYEMQTKQSCCVSVSNVTRQCRVRSDPHRMLPKPQSQTGHPSLGSLWAG